LATATLAGDCLAGRCPSRDALDSHSRPTTDAQTERPLSDHRHLARSDSTLDPPYHPSAQ
jgi:hypothetical protein